MKDLTPNGKLPPILPIVLYNGERSWSAPTQIADLIADAAGLDAFQPSFEILVLDEGRIPAEQLAALESPVAAMFEIEQSRDLAELGQVIDKLCRILADDSLKEVRKDFATWIQRVIVPARFEDSELPQLEELKEFRAMIEERVKQWTKEWWDEGYREGVEEGRREGVEEGRREGVEEGRREGLVRALNAQLQLKFGPIPGSEVQRLDEATSEQLESWSRRVLIANEMDEVFGD